MRTGMDRCIFDDTESEYFWEKKRFSVDGALENGRLGLSLDLKKNRWPFVSATDFIHSTGCGKALL